jgi:hypothetical protein
MLNNDVLAAIYTETTCGEACWFAREDTCRCSCNGRNHGCLKVEGAERPPRTRRVQGVRYRMYGIMEWYVARSIGHKLTWPNGSGAKPFRGTQSIEESIGKRHAKWPECEGQTGTILWVREHIANETIADIEAALKQERAKRDARLEEMRGKV